jgi:hypothetical protein
VRYGAFDTELSIQGASATTWRLLAPLIWTGTKDDTFTVPVGFVTDFATVPRFLHWLVSPYGAYTRAAVLHDWLLVELAAFEQRDRTDPPPPATSRDADGIFRRVMEDLGVPWAKRWLMWTAVRWASLFNPNRAYGRQIVRDLSLMLVWSLVSLPVMLPGVVGVLISLGLTKLIPNRVRNDRRPEAPAPEE